jgi:hypothetical protein
VTSAADSESIELWKLINSNGRWVEPDLIGGWSVALLPQARAQRLRFALPAFLRRLERAGVREVRSRTWDRGQFEEAASSLGISHLSQFGLVRDAC